MDMFGGDPSVVVVSDDSAQAEESNQESPEFLRGQLEAERQARQEREDELRRSQQALQAILIQQQQMQQQNEYDYRTEPRQVNEQQQDPWAEYYRALGINGGGTEVQQPQQPDNAGNNAQQRQLTVDEAAALAARIADERINATLQALNQDTQVGNQLAHKFQTEDADLLPYSDVVSRFYAANLHLGKAQAYNIAVATVRQMRDQGRLAAPVQPNVPQIPMGGQWRTTAQLQNGQQMVRIDDEFRRKELEEWTRKRKELFEKKKAANY